MGVERNPFYPKYFLTVGGHEAKVWSEDLKTDAILATNPSPSRLTSAAWCPGRMSMFLTTNIGGFLEIRDYLISHSSAFLQIKIADYALHCIKVSSEEGGLAQNIFFLNSHNQTSSTSNVPGS